MCNALFVLFTSFSSLTLGSVMFSLMPRRAIKHHIDTGIPKSSITAYHYSMNTDWLHWFCSFLVVSTFARHSRWVEKRCTSHVQVSFPNKWGVMDGKGLQQARSTLPPCWGVNDNCPGKLIPDPLSEPSQQAHQTCPDLFSGFHWWMRCWRLRKGSLGNLEILATSGRFLQGGCLMKTSPWRI